MARCEFRKDCHVGSRCRRNAPRGERFCWQHRTRESVQAKLDAGYRRDDLERAVETAERAAIEYLMGGFFYNDGDRDRVIRFWGFRNHIESARQALAEAKQ